MNDYIIEIEESEDYEVKDITNGMNLLTINCSSDSPPNPEPVIHSMSGSTFEVIKTDEEVARDQSSGNIQNHKETFLQSFEERKEAFFEDSNQERQEKMITKADKSNLVADLQMARFQQNDEPDLSQMKDVINEKVKPYEEKRPRRRLIENFIDKNQEIKERSKIPNKGLRNLGNTCYINALLQCLYHIERFREYIIEVQEQEGLPLLGKLANFFIAMKNDDYREIEKAHEDLLEKIREIRCEVMKNVQGDSTSLFRAIIEELSFEQEDFRHLPQLEMFAGGELTKTKTCSYCKEVKRTSQLIKILEVRDVNFQQTNQINYFHSPEEIRFCPKSRESEKHFCEYVTSGLPEILVFRIQDTINCDKRVEILPELFLKQINYQNRKMVVHYEFLAGVVNVKKGGNGVHSVEISRHGDLYYEFNDFRVNEINLEDIKYHPKLLFYKRCL